jgi:hypothetical protein
VSQEQAAAAAETASAAAVVLETAATLQQTETQILVRVVVEVTQEATAVMVVRA